MIIEIIDDENYLNQDQIALIIQLVNHTANKLNLPEESEVDISIVDNETIHQLNRDYRQVDRPTDVLSFALEEDLEDAPKLNPSSLIAEGIPTHLGDIIISHPKAVEQAQDYNHSIDRELGFLAVHGFLHLNGFDHMTDEDEAVMFQLQDEVLIENGLTR